MFLPVLYKHVSEEAWLLHDLSIYILIISEAFIFEITLKS